MRLSEFLEKVKFHYDTWDDYGYKTTAKLKFDSEQFFVHIFPNKEENYKRIKANLADNSKHYFFVPDEKYYDFIQKTLEDESERNQWFELTGDIAYKGPAFIKEYDEINAKFHKLAQTDEYPDEELNLKYLRELFDDSFFRGITDWRTELYGLHRMTQNETRLFDYKFTIKRYSEELLKVNVRRSDNISVEVNNETLPMTISSNVYCIIGENGSGKTNFIRELSKAILGEKSELELDYSEFDIKENANTMNRVIYCSFSPFDEKVEIIDNMDTEEERFQYVGVLDSKYTGRSIREAIVNDIMESLREIKLVERKSRYWLEVMERMSYERWIYRIIEIFQNDLESVYTGNNDNSNWNEYDYKDPSHTFKKIKELSSGQKIFTLTVTKLIQYLTQRTIVFIDEPELFLHPPMIKSYVRILSDLVTAMNGLGFIITHSPITLQEFPNQCVMVAEKDIRSNYRINPISCKTFGENINIINDKVFNVGLQQSGFYNFIESLKNEERIADLKRLRDFSGTEAGLLINLFLERFSDEKN